MTNGGIFELPDCWIFELNDEERMMENKSFAFESKKSVE